MTARGGEWRGTSAESREQRAERRVRGEVASDQWLVASGQERNTLNFAFCTLNFAFCTLHSAFCTLHFLRGFMVKKPEFLP
ncbi:MAG: hypothetical protein FWH27_16190 [Planctomycetaceae bacterium]|nr:hypothetical protein [Planctomycetaceae bacterium]